MRKSAKGGLLCVVLAVVVFALACGRGKATAGGSGTVQLPPGAIPATVQPIPAPPPPAPAIVSAEGTPLSFGPLAKRADPSVATVKARVERELPSGRRRVMAEGLGTAFVYDAEGFLLTNNHVIEDATDVTVGFLDGRELKATIVGRDKHTDIAVVKVEEKGLPALPLGDSDKIEVGDWVVA